METMKRKLSKLDKNEMILKEKLEEEKRKSQDARLMVRWTWIGSPILSIFLSVSALFISKQISNRNIDNNNDNNN